MSKTKFRQRVPSPWHVAELTVPRGESVDAFGEKLARHITPRLDRSWAWTHDDDRVVFATARLTALPVLLAHVLGAVTPGAPAVR